MKLGTISIAVIALAGALLLGASDTSGVQSGGPPGCSETTLNGSYGFYRTGINPDGPLAAVGIVTYDGKGNYKGWQRISRNGTLDSGNFSDEYNVAANCVGKSSNTRFVIVDGGNEFYFLSEAGDNVVYGVAKKIHP